MPITEQLMDVGSFEVNLDPATPQRVLDDIGINRRLWSTYVHTPAHFTLGDLDDADLLSVARYTGRVLGQPHDRLGVRGEQIVSWLGQDDGGDLFSGVDTSVSGLDLEAHLDARVFAAANGLTKGSVNSNGTTFTHAREGGDTRREMLDTLAASAPGGPYFWRCNSNDFTIDVDLLATLWPTATTPTVILSEEGGRAIGVVGLYAEIAVDDIDGSEVRTAVQVDWNDGTGNGTSSASLPATYGDLVGGSPTDIHYMDWRPKRPQPPTERWRRFAVWAIKAQARADILAQRDVNERSQIRTEITADLHDLVDPWRFDITPGNTVYLSDLDRGLVNTVNEVYYRGEATHPTTGRVDEMITPLHEGGGHYLRCFDGVSAFEWIDLTQYVLPEDGPVQLGIDRRSRFPVIGRHRVRTKRERRSWYARAHQKARLDKFYAGLARR